MRIVLVCVIVAMQIFAAHAYTYYYATYNELGCWKDTSNRAIPTREGDPILDGEYPNRKKALLKCARVANNHNNGMFAVQNGGWCASSDNAISTYQKYGVSNDCKSNGLGGPWANQVYEIKYIAKVQLIHLGCWADTSNRAVSPLDGSDPLLTDNYKSREDSIHKCTDVALSHGYDIIAVQDGGWCASARNAVHTYKKYGHSSSCSNGKGGPWANDVYRLDIVWERRY